MLRRKFLKILTSTVAIFASGLVTPTKAFAEWNQAAFSAKDFNAAIKSLEKKEFNSIFINYIRDHNLVHS